MKQTFMVVAMLQEMDCSGASNRCLRCIDEERFSGSKKGIGCTAHVQNRGPFEREADVTSVRACKSRL